MNKYFINDFSDLRKLFGDAQNLDDCEEETKIDINKKKSIKINHKG